MKSSIQRHCGWTLVEVMIVVSIMGILMVMAIPKVHSVHQNAKRKRAQAQLEFVAAAIHQLAQDTGRLPGGRMITNPGSQEYVITNALCGLMNNPASLFTARWKGPYLDKVPKDPWGNDYCYDPDYRFFSPGGVATSSLTVVFSMGPNKKARSVMSGGLNYDPDDVYIDLAVRK